MARPRLEFQQILQALMPDGKKVWHQEPKDDELDYPVILYQRDGEQTDHADNRPVRTTDRYQVTVIDRDPDSDIPAKVRALPMSSFASYFRADQLHHHVYTIFY